MNLLLAMPGGSEWLLILIVLFPIVLLWKIFEKAGQPGWVGIIPIYNLYVILKIIGKPWWWLLLCIIPYIGLIWSIWSINLFLKRFGKTELFTIGFIFLPFIFVPILAFGNSKFTPLQ